MGDVKVTINFTDVKDDGLANNDNPNSCLDTKFMRYSTETFNGGITYNNTITSTYDTINLKRVWSFTIKSSDLNTVLVHDDSEIGYTTYFGFFSL